MKRTATARWNGSLKEGNGVISTASGVLDDTQYSFGTRFEDGPRQPRLPRLQRHVLGRARGPVRRRHFRRPRRVPVDGEALRVSLTLLALFP